MFSLAFISFIAGILTILAPCVLPILPVILAGLVGEKQKWYPYVITGSLALSIVIFTIILKVSTLFIGVPSEFWKYFSGIILLALGMAYMFPHVWTQISSKVFGSRANIALDTAQDIGNPLLRAIITGAVLGPVFSTCSPTYTLLLATVFPVSLISGAFYTLIYALGLSFVLLLISIFGTSLMRKLKIFADEKGIFRKVLGIILAIVGLVIITGIDKRLEATILQKYDIPSIENSVINQLFPNFNHMNTPITPTTDASNLKKAYFAGGCFWCMEGIFEAQEGVKEAISGYAEGSLADATYERVSAGNTTHREAIEVTYDPAKISYSTLVDLYYTQIDPTQVDGQFADRGFRYTTAIYYQDESEKEVIDQARKILESKKKYDKPIAVKTVPFTTFFPAEEYHQDYYKKSAFRYNLYKEGSGRAGFIHENAETGVTLMLSSNDQYKDYDDVLLSTLTGSRILLFFHADWCPTCQNFEKQILKTTLPKDVVILKVDYDTATELKQKYSILSQSTFIQVDSRGNMYKRWLGKSELSDIIIDMVTSQDLLSKKLTPLQYQVTQMGGTEKPFDNAYWDNHEAGIYVDIVDGTPLFSSLDKFDSRTGWPSFSRPIDASMIDSKSDTSLFTERTEIVSKNAKSHLGHVFDDGPQDQGGKRYCINSAALRFIPAIDLEKEGYGKYKPLFSTNTKQK